MLDFPEKGIEMEILDIFKEPHKTVSKRIRGMHDNDAEFKKKKIMVWGTNGINHCYTQIFR